MQWTLSRVILGLLIGFLLSPAFRENARIAYHFDQLPAQTAINALSTALKRDLSDAQRRALYQMRAECSIEISAFSQAVADISQAILLAEDESLWIQADLYTTRGQYRLYLYEWDAVLADYNEAIRLAPSFANAYFHRGVLYYSVLTDRIPRETALADFQTYLHLAPHGRHAAEATRYSMTIQAELDALSS